MNENYWKKRQEETIQEILKEADVSADYIAEIYHKSALYTQNKIKGIFDKYRLKHGLSITEAKALLESLENPHDLDEMLKRLRNGIKSDERKELLKRLEAPAYRYRINRFVDMQHQTDELMKYVYDVEKEISTKSYINAAYNTYYRDVFNIQKDVGVAYRFNNLDSKLVEQMLRSKWSGENYSSRIWGNTQDLTNTLKDEMVLGILTNKTEKEMMDTIIERFSIGAYKARRLIVTESAAISSFADQLAFEDAGIETEMFIAVHDGKTSMVCQKHDRSIVEVGKGEVGRNIPPLHPNCRSKMIPYIEGITDDMKVRQRDPITGRDEVVKVGETYDQWLKRQQETHGVDTVDKFRKKVENFSIDKEQYHRYKSVLGDEFIPNSLEKFQEIKYSNGNEWNDLKYKYRTVNRYKIDYGYIDSKTILELDHEAFIAKDKYMTTKAAKGNVASMRIGNDVFIASSRISNMTESTYINYKGDTEELILLPKVRRLTPHLKDSPFLGHEGEYSRDIDTEYKFFEYIYEKVLNGELKNQEISILSQKSMCFSCDSVYNELMEKQEVIDANIRINVVSGKTNDSWVYRKYSKEAMNNMKNKKKKGE